MSGVKIDPFAMEPIRENVLQLPQILKEMSSLDSSISKIKENILKSEQHLASLASSSSSHSNNSHTSPSLKSEKDAKHIVKTSQVYGTKGPLPQRFEEPGTWNYKVKKQNPMYTTTTNQYGYLRPTVHDMPTIFRGQTSKFSEVFQFLKYIMIL